VLLFCNVHFESTDGIARNVDAICCKTFVQSTGEIKASTKSCCCRITRIQPAAASLSSAAMAWILMACRQGTHKKHCEVVVVVVVAVVACSASTFPLSFVSGILMTTVCLGCTGSFLSFTQCSLLKHKSLASSCSLQRVLRVSSGVTEQMALPILVLTFWCHCSPGDCATKGSDQVYSLD
jgi:hypothetical protein